MRSVVLLTILRFLSAASVQQIFNEWQITYKDLIIPKNDKTNRMHFFLENLKQINKHNSKENKTYEAGVNQFSDLTFEEFVNYKCGIKLPKRLVSDENENDTEIIHSISSDRIARFGNYDADAPDSVNFTYLMQPVLDQKSCSSCWAFTAMSQLEGLLKNKNPKFQEVLSPQFLLDCNSEQYGCIGGWPTDALYWLHLRFGGNNKAPTLSNYPYKGSVGACTKKTTAVSLDILKVNEMYLEGNEDDLKVIIANHGPIISIIYVTSKFQSYKSGVFFNPQCPSDCDFFNHAVVVVGYGTDGSLGDYWIAKNSWSTSWGENGYIRMARNKGNNCNIACYAIFAE